MPGLLLHNGAIITCPHPVGTVTALPGSPRVLLDGKTALTMLHVHTVKGCQFTIPTPGGPVLHPCVTVRVEPAKKVLINNVAAAILTPSALCYAVDQAPQGPPNSSPTQMKVIAL
jgi:hypothetical protein